MKAARDDLELRGVEAKGGQVPRRLREVVEVAVEPLRGYRQRGGKVRRVVIDEPERVQVDGGIWLLHAQRAELEVAMAGRRSRDVVCPLLEQGELAGQKVWRDGLGYEPRRLMRRRDLRVDRLRNHASRLSAHQHATCQRKRRATDKTREKRRPAIRQPVRERLPPRHFCHCSSSESSGGSVSPRFSASIRSRCRKMVRGSTPRSFAVLVRLPPFRSSTSLM